jgi:hypothetical protein
LEHDLLLFDRACWKRRCSPTGFFLLIDRCLANGQRNGEDRDKRGGARGHQPMPLAPVLQPRILQLPPEGNPFRCLRAGSLHGPGCRDPSQDLSNQPTPVAGGG